jgi:hypothetical protein
MTMKDAHKVRLVFIAGALLGIIVAELARLWP